MPEYIVNIPDAHPYLRELQASFLNGPILPNGLRLLTEDTVDTIGSIRIQIFAKDHPPPHFRISYQGESADYKISDCSPITPVPKAIDRFRRNILEWHELHQHILVETWNRLRPTNCPVGTYRA